MLLTEMTLSPMPEWAQIIIRTLLIALRERDPYTYGHSKRVAHNAKLLAHAAGLSQDECSTIEISSLFHDLGKLGIPDSILMKPGRLTPEEASIIRQHPAKSTEIIAPLTHFPLFKNSLPGIRHHHERMDGFGYPDRIRGEQIPIHARIILISDTFDAMTTTRPYRKGLPVDLAYKELNQFAGRQFDQDLVKIFLQAHRHWQKFDEEATEEFISATFKRAA